MNIDYLVGHCTQDEAYALARAAFEALPTADQYRLLEEMLSDEQKEECAAKWINE